MTSVLLVCVYNKNGSLITHNVYYQLFSKYGKVYRILIFQKAKVWKAFVEMDSIDNANRAKEKLNDYVIFQDGSKINVFFSSLETIKFQNDNSGGVDYTLIQTHQNPKKGQSPLQAKPASSLPGEEHESVTTDDFKLEYSLQKLDNIVQDIEDEERFQHYVHPLFLQENKESPVLYCRGIDNPDITKEYLMTLFMNFGNVVQIVKIPQKKAALVEFQNEVFSTQAKDYLNNQSFMGCQLKIFYSNYQSIQQRKKKTE